MLEQGVILLWERRILTLPEYAQLLTLITDKVVHGYRLL